VSRGKILVVFDKKGGKDSKLLIESSFLGFYIRGLSLSFTLIKILSTEYFDALILRHCSLAV
jgi:hypothetical protein